MGIYVKGMTKPTNCDQCPIALWALPKDCNLEIGMCPIIEVDDYTFEVLSHNLELEEEQRNMGYTKRETEGEEGEKI